MLEDEHRNLVNLLLLLQKLNEYILVDSLSIADLEVFEDVYISYLELRKGCKERYQTFGNLTPKDHFIEHYKQQILRHGPPNVTWTAVAERKHQEFLKVALYSKNYINLPKTLAVKSQKMLALRLSKGIFTAPKLQFPNKMAAPTTQELQSYPGILHTSDLVTSAATVTGTAYRTGHLVVTRITSSDIIEVSDINWNF